MIDLIQTGKLTRERLLTDPRTQNSVSETDNGKFKYLDEVKLYLNTKLGIDQIVLYLKRLLDVAGLPDD